MMTEFADWGLFDAETESARKGLPERAVSVVECVCSGADATPSPSRRGLKHRPSHHQWGADGDATPSPSRRGLKRPKRPGENSEPTDATPSPSRRGLKHSLFGRWVRITCDATPSPSRRGLKPSWPARATAYPPRDNRTRSLWHPVGQHLSPRW